MNISVVLQAVSTTPGEPISEAIRQYGLHVCTRKKRVHIYLPVMVN